MSSADARIHVQDGRSHDRNDTIGLHTAMVTCRGHSKLEHAVWMYVQVQSRAPWMYSREALLPLLPSIWKEFGGSLAALVHI